MNCGGSSNSFLQVINIAAKAQHNLCLLIFREVRATLVPTGSGRDYESPVHQSASLCYAGNTRGGQRWIGLCENLINAFVPTKLLSISSWVKKLLYLAATLSNASPPPHFLRSSEQSPFFL